MNDHSDSFDLQDPTPLLVPSSLLSQWLAWGSLGVILAGISFATASILEIQQGKVKEMVLSHYLDFGTYLILLLGLYAYLHLGREAGSLALQRSVFGLLWALFFWDLAGFATSEFLSQGWQIGLWILTALGLLSILGIPFFPFLGVKPQAAAETQSPTHSSPPGSDITENGKKAAGIGGGIAVTLAILFKFLGQGLLAKFFAAKFLVRIINQLNWSVEFVVWIALVSLGAVFLLWFALVKISLRKKLGSLAVLAGLAEIAGMMAGMIALGFFLAALNEPGKKPEEIVDEWRNIFSGLGVIFSSGWALTTASLFLTIRNRLNPMTLDWDQNFQSDNNLNHRDDFSEPYPDSSS